MRDHIRLTAICIAAALAASAATVTAGVGIYTDVKASVCTLEDVVPGLHEVFIVYTGGSAIDAIEFQVVQTSGAALTYLSEQGPDPTWSRYGRAPDGITVMMGACRPAPVYVLTVFYAGGGASSPCGRLELRNSPISFWPENPGFIATLDCSSPPNLVWVPSEDAVINPDEECNCASGAPTPTAESTWGGIKALYDE